MVAASLGTPDSDYAKCRSLTVLLGVSLAWPTAKQLVSILLRRYCSNLA